MGCGSTKRIDSPTRDSIATYAQLYAAIAKGAKLVVLEDSVIDLRSFLSIHPGGPEVFSPCIGIVFI